MKRGAIVRIDTTRSQRPLFVNSNVQNLGLFLAMFVSHCHLTTELPFDEVTGPDDPLESCMKSIAPDALSEKIWWHTILETLKEGML
ncbi:hypothetical protein SAMN05444166_8496 [Singulisphaera sp. GP187]|nr:hypothetical protein SAMN05444166_8496 [Singulisphaera sp. GP187]